MALAALTLDLLKQLLPTVEAGGCASRRIVSLGYPDILATPDQVRRIFGDGIFGQLRYREDSASILRWHGGGAEAGSGKVVDADSLFSALGYQLDVIDIVAARGGEIIHDLNEPLPEELKGRYAAVLDAGTLEHCFNIAEAVRSVSAMAAVGGIVMHGNPLNMYNHGFYNLNPTWYQDFYGTNGFAIELMKVVVDAVAAPKLGDVPPYERFRGAPENAVLLVVARRREMKAVAWPVQKKYRDNPMLAK